MKFTFIRNLSMGFGLSLLILLLSTAASYFSINNLLKSLHLVNQTDSIIHELQNVFSTLKDAETGQRGYLLTGEKEFLEPYIGAEQKALKTLGTIKELTMYDSVQYGNCDRLQQIINERIFYLKDLIDRKKANKPFTNAELVLGKSKMDEARSVVKIMEDRARFSLVSKNERLALLINYTPVAITVGALLALSIAIIFYGRIRNDFETRSRLQQELKQKDHYITRRIEIIQDIATRISAGNYLIRINNEEKDTLGSLGDSLNRMAESLQYSFDLLLEKEWLSSGIAELNNRMTDETDIYRLSSNIIKHLSNYTNSQVGTLYLLENEDVLNLTGTYAFVDDGARKVFKLGEGLIGECALSGQQKVLKEFNNDCILINFATGQIKPKSIIAVPVFYEKKLKGVIELATINEFSKKDLSFLTSITQYVGIGINSVQNRIKLQQFLEETQSQGEKLHAQHSDLQNVNAELEVSTRNLQASEQLLKIHQQELENANQELEGRTSLLEERNKIILAGNIAIQVKGEELRLSNQYKSEFLSNMSHELRTPLNSILLLSGLMANNKDRKLNEEHVEFAKVIHNSGNGLLELIDEILDLSKIESGKMDLCYEHTLINDMVVNMMDLFTEVANQKEIEFIINVDPQVPLNIETDRMRLEQVIKNLISNALKFTSVGGKVIFSISKPLNQDKFIVFAVKDTGIGIATEKQEIIFKAFQQADGSTQREYGGTGLGLSISLKLVNLLGGEIKLNSEIDKGSIFTVHLPCSKPRSIKLPDRKNLDIPGIEYLKPTPLQLKEQNMIYPLKEHIADDREEITLGEKVILIIEEDVMVARMLLDFARQNGWKAIVALRGDVGLDLAKKFIPTGILLDIQVPGKDGWQVIAEIKNNLPTRHIPVHIISSNNFKKESIDYGAADFINKPISFDKIAGAFEKLNVMLTRKKGKVLILEENEMHAKALAFYLQSENVNIEIKNNIDDGIESLFKVKVDCVIVVLNGTDGNSYDIVEKVRNTEELEKLAIIIFTDQYISERQEPYIKQYADCILLKDTDTYKSILYEVSAFLKPPNEEKDNKISDTYKTPGSFNEVLKGKTILIVDNDIRNIFSLTKALEAIQMHVVTAMDGKELLLVLKENPDVAIIIMDMIMPQINGFEATRQIRRNTTMSSIPIIAQTTKTLPGNREKSIEAGASDLITKPVDIDKLLSFLRVWLYENHFNKNKEAEDKY
ncbi:MAG: response regulator [Chitinophagaceae bacterium]